MFVQKSHRIRLFNDKDEGDARFCGAEVVAALGADFGPADGAPEFVVTHADISRADRSFEAPAVAEEKLITIGKAASHAPALIAVRFGTATEKHPQIVACDIILCAEGMQPEKMTVEPLTQPIAIFRRSQPMYQFMSGIGGVGVNQLYPPLRSRVVRGESPNSNPRLGAAATAP